MGGVIYFLLIIMIPPGSETIHIRGRDLSGLQEYEKIIHGTCDGTPASFTIRTATREQPGRLVLRAGSFERELPPTFLDGSLVTNGLYHTGLACDGRSVQLTAETIRDAGDQFILVRQNAVIDIRTGILTLRDLRRLSPEQSHSELTSGRDTAIDASGRLSEPR